MKVAISGINPDVAFSFSLVHCVRCLRAFNKSKNRLGAVRMTISEAQLRTLRLLNRRPARCVYRSERAEDYLWTHEDSRIALTATLHRLFSSGYATVSSANRDMAVITHKGRAVVAARGSA
jgi:hypothetical protein